MSNVTNVTDETFEQIVLQSPIPVIVEFGATWCGPCKAMAPILERIASEANGRFNVIAVDVDDCPVAARTYGIRSVPTVIAFVGGKVTKSLVGLQRKESLLALVTA